MTVGHSDAELDDRACGRVEKHTDQQPSFTDRTGAVVRRTPGAAAVLGLVADFTILGFALEPT